MGAPAGCDSKAAYGGNSDIDGSVTYDVTENAMQLFKTTDTAIGMAYPAFNVEAGGKFDISVTFKSDAVYASGVYIRVYEYNADLPTGKTVVSNNASMGPSYVQQATSGGPISPSLDNIGVSDFYQTEHTTYTPSASAKWASVVILNWTGMGISPLFVRPLTPMAQPPTLSPTLSALTVTGYIENQGSELKINKQYAYNLPNGWYSVALVAGSSGGSGAGTGGAGARASASFNFNDRASGRHQSIMAIVAHHFGNDDSNNIQILNTSNFTSSSPSPIGGIRLKELDTYDGAVLQIYLNYVAANRISAVLTDNNQTSGWCLLDALVPDATDPSNAVCGVGYNNSYSSFVVRENVDLIGISQGGFRIGGNARFDGDVTIPATPNAVLISDSNGKISAAANLSDVPYLPQGAAGSDPYMVLNPTLWQAAPPNTIDEAIHRIAAQLNTVAGPIP